MALCELISTREELARRVLVLLLVTCPVVLGACYVFSLQGSLTVMRVAEIHMLGVAAVFFGEIALLWRAGTRLPLTLSLGALYLGGYGATRLLT